MDHPSRTLPVAPGRVPVLGHLGQLATRPLPFVRSLPRHGRIVRIYFGDRPVHVVTDAVLLREILVRQGRDFDKGSIFDQGKAFLGEGLITSAGERHQRHRRLIQPPFLPNRMSGHVERMREEAAAACYDWRPERPVAVDEAMRWLAFRVISRTISSREVDPALAERLHRSLPSLVRGAMLRAFLPAVLRRLPIGLDRRYRRVAADVRSLVDEFVVTGAALPARPADLVCTLRQARDPATGEPMSTRQIADEVLTILVSGTETTGDAMAWVFYELARRPDVERAVHDEIDVQVGTRRGVAYHDLDRLAYTGRVVSETLRLRGPWLSTRRAMSPVVLDGTRFPAGTEFAFSLYALHRDPELFPRPDRFDPDRWLPERAGRLPRGAFIPFLDGQRKCLGDSFAWTEMLVTIATVGARWRLRPTPGLRVREKPVGTIRPSRLTMLPVPR